MIQRHRVIIPEIPEIPLFFSLLGVTFIRDLQLTHNENIVLVENKFHGLKTLKVLALSVPETHPNLFLYFFPEFTSPGP